MKSPRPKRLRKERVPWEAAVTPTLGAAKKSERKAPRTSKTDVLKPIPFEPLPASIERPLPCYTPPLKIRKKQGRPTFSNLSPIETFKRFICVTIIGLVAISTNAYAKRQRAEDIQNQSSSARTWKPTTVGEIYRYIGVWLYMGMHPEADRSSFWSQTHRLGRYMAVLGIIIALLSSPSGPTVAKATRRHLNQRQNRPSSLR